MINDHQKEFIKLLERLAAGHRNIFDAFRDVVGCIACAVEQLCHWPQERDGRYNSIVAGDIDQRALDCAFSEFSLLGYSARVERRNALTMEMLGKPRWTVNYFIYGTQWREGKRNAQ